MEEEKKSEKTSYTESYLKYNTGDFDVMPVELRVPPWRSSSDKSASIKKTSFTFKEDLYISVISCLVSKLPINTAIDIENLVNTAQKITEESYNKFIQ